MEVGKLESLLDETQAAKNNTYEVFRLIDTFAIEQIAKGIPMINEEAYYLAQYLNKKAERIANELYTLHIGLIELKEKMSGL